MLFCPARQDIPGLVQPIVALSGDMDEQGTPDFVVVSQQIQGDITQGSVTVFLSDGAGAYTQASYRVIGGSPQAAALGDFNGDTHLDLAVTHPLSSSVSILLGTGNGAFAPPQTLSLPAGPTAIASADFNGDSHADLILVTSTSGFPGTLRIYAGQGNGTFSQISTATVGLDPIAIVVAKLNQDATLDVAVGNRTGQSVTFVPGLAGGLLGTPVQIGLGASVSTIAAGDLNNDGKPDLIAGGNTTGSSVIPLLGNGTGGFTPGTPVALGSDIPSLDVCDFDRDGKLDVLAAKFTADTVTLLRGKGNGTFDLPTNLGANSRPKFVHAGDLNNDGFCDAVVANQVAGSLSLFLGDGLGNVGTPSFTSGATPLSVATGDFNGDGLPDLAAANRDNDTVSVFFGDGEGRMTLVQLLFAGPNPGAVTVRDLNGDGVEDIAVANQGPAGSTQASTATIFFGDGSGHFPTSIDLTAGRLPLDILSEDFDGDGLYDIAVANGGSDTISVFLSQGGGSFGARKNTKVGGQPRSLAALQIDGDGILDLAVSEGTDNDIDLLLGAGNGTFSKSGVTLPGGGLNVDDLISADFNGDGLPDLAWIDQQAVNQPSSISVFLHDSGSSFVEAPTSDLPTGTFAESLSAIDMDRQGGIDIVVVNRFDDTAQVYFGDGNGNFSSGGTLGVGHEPFATTVADFNLDGREDLATADFNGDSVSVLLNNTYIDADFATVHATGPTTFEWDPFPGASSYRVYRGDSSILRQRDYGTCLDNNATTSFEDPEVPPPGKAFFYIATPVVNGVEEFMGLSSSCLKRVNLHPCNAP